MKITTATLLALTLSIGTAQAHPGHALEGTVMHSVQHSGDGWLLGAGMLLALAAVGYVVKRAVQRDR